MLPASMERVGTSGPVTWKVTAETFKPHCIQMKACFRHHLLKFKLDAMAECQVPKKASATVNKNIFAYP